MSENQFDLMHAAVAEAETTMRAADNMAYKIAPLLRGRLRKCSRYVLADLKRELTKFDAHKKEWKPNE